MPTTVRRRFKAREAAAVASVRPASAGGGRACVLETLPVPEGLVGANVSAMS